MQDSNAPGALFSGDAPPDEKPVVPNANEMWQRMHSDPLLLIKQQEQQALSRIRSNPVQMAMIRKEVRATPRKTPVSRLLTEQISLWGFKV